jgi:putative membrane protein
VATLVAIAVAAGLYAAGVRRWDRAHPSQPFPRRRVWWFAGGLATIGVALVGPIEGAAGVRFSAHMVQHVLLTLVAPPLLLLGRPLLLARRAAPAPVRGAVTRALRSRSAHRLAHPVVAWASLAVVLWASHFTSLYDAAIRSDAVHAAEHLLYLGAGLLFWFPVVAADPSPWRLGHGARLLYVFVALPANALLALSLYESGRVLYSSYGGAGALADQRVAAAIMWVFGGLLLLAAMLVVAASWARTERRSPSAPRGSRSAGSGGKHDLTHDVLRSGQDDGVSREETLGQARG